MPRPASVARTVTARVLPQFGIDPRRTAAAMRDLPGWQRSFRRFRAEARTQRMPRPLVRDAWPIVGERDDPAGSVRGHYFHQDLWAARLVHATGPSTHVDVGSRIDGFVLAVLAFMPVTVVDIRPLDSTPEGLTFRQGDATALPFGDQTITSISSLHAVEHFGLGRYGDPIDPGAHLRGMTELARVAAPGGRVYFGVPVGRERVMFNAHRVLSPQTVLRAFAPLDLLSFSAVNDSGDVVNAADPEDFGDADYSCGLFEFGRP